MRKCNHAPPPTENQSEAHDHRDRNQIDFERFVACPPRTFRARQWDAVVLHYRDGLREREVAIHLGVTVKAVYALLTRANRNRERYEEKLRTEKFELLRKWRET